MTIYYRNLKELCIYQRTSHFNGKRIYFLIREKIVTGSFIHVLFTQAGPEWPEACKDKLPVDGTLELDGRLVCEVPTIDAGLAILKILS